MHGRVAVDLAGRGLQDLARRPLGEAEHVDRAVHAGLGRLHRVVLVVDRRGRAGEVVDLVDLDVERKVTSWRISSNEGWPCRLARLSLGAGVEVVDAEHVVALSDKPLAEVAAEETGAAGDEDAFGMAVFAHGEAQERPMPT
jgi:hypothetical protein